MGGQKAVPGKGLLFSPGTGQVLTGLLETWAQLHSLFLQASLQGTVGLPPHPPAPPPPRPALTGCPRGWKSHG